jgi:4-diphosphocytidyl-2-C-methyl-D-erythritol kinase
MKLWARPGWSWDRRFSLPSAGNRLHDSRPPVSNVTIFSPAKLNLFLAVTGKRPDGFHDLVSVAVPLAWGDELRVAPAETFSLTCNDPAVPVDGTNLILKAAQSFRTATGWTGGARFELEKRIPMGAGLGGGSSNAVAALRALNQFAGQPLDAKALADLAAGIGSDCALFLPGVPVAMRGRGEIVQPLAASPASRLRGRKVLVFKPSLGVATPWAYARLAAGAPHTYLPTMAAEDRLAGWSDDPGASAEELLFNSFEEVVFEKYIALPVLLAQLRQRFSLTARMSGSGSACFALLDDRDPVEEITAAIRAAWGAAALIVATKIA